jgi:transposase
MTSQRRKFTAAQKSKIALSAIKGELTIAEIASKYSIHPTQINKWKKLALSHIPEAFTGKQKQVDKEHSDELSVLYEQIGRLKVENEFLKKKCDLFTE